MLEIKMSFRYLYVYLNSTPDLLAVGCHRHHIELEVLRLFVLVIKPLRVPHPDD